MTDFIGGKKSRNPCLDRPILIEVFRLLMHQIFLDLSYGSFALPRPGRNEREVRPRRGPPRPRAAAAGPWRPWLQPLPALPLPARRLPWRWIPWWRFQIPL